MAYLAGTAADHIDLLKQLVTFVTTNATLIADGEKWEVLRKAGVTNINASSFTVLNEPWVAFKGTYGEHVGQWSTAVTAVSNSWLSWDMFEPMDIARLVLQAPSGGATIINQAPNVFNLEWYDDVNAVWRIRASYTAGVWTSGQVREFTLPAWPLYTVLGVPTDLSGPKTKWRIFVVSNNGNTSFTSIQGVRLPVFEESIDYDYARKAAVWLKAPGMTGLDPVYLTLMAYDRETNDIYNWAASISTGFLADSNITDQPGAAPPIGVTFGGTPFPFWLSANGQRVTGVAKIGSKYIPFYFGKILTFGTPLQYPYPIVMAGSLTTPSATTAASVTTLPYKGAGQTIMQLRNNAGAWVAPTTHPYSSNPTYRDTFGPFPIIPITLYQASEFNTYGVLDGVSFVTGFGNAPENTVTVGAEVHTVFNSPGASGLKDYYALRTT